MGELAVPQRFKTPEPLASRNGGLFKVNPPYATLLVRRHEVSLVERGQRREVKLTSG